MEEDYDYLISKDELKDFRKKASDIDSKYHKYFYLISLAYYFSILSEGKSKFSFWGINFSMIFKKPLLEGVLILGLSILFFRLLYINKIVSKITDMLKKEYFPAGLPSFFIGPSYLKIIGENSYVISYILPFFILIYFYIHYFLKVFKSNNINAYILLFFSTCFLLCSIHLFYIIIKNNI